MTRLYERLEQEFGAWAGVSNVVACSSGGAALHLAIEALQLPRGSRVIVPEFTMIACARAVILASLEPVFVDCSDDLLLNVDLLKDHPPKKVKAIMPVHVYGRQCNMDRIHDLAEKYGWAVIEDLAEAHGIDPDLRSNAACWSFYRNKIIAGEEGGAVAFKEQKHADLARKLRCYGQTIANDCSYVPRGWNYRMTDALAKPILESLKNADVNLRLRKQVATWYDELIPAEWKMPSRDVDWVYDLRIPGLTIERQDRIIAQLKQSGVEARHGFKPLSHQREYRGKNHRTLNAAKLSREVLYLPINSEMTQDEVCRNAGALLTAAAPGPT